MPLTSQKSSQKLHPLSLLAQMMSRQISGCLQVHSDSASWQIYLEQGKLIYATNSINPFDRLDHHLHRLSHYASSLVSAVRVQVRLLFDITTPSDLLEGRDYQAICWLVEQQHLTASQAANLIDSLAKEVLEAFLAIQEGSYEVVYQHPLNDRPRFCYLELRPLVEYCQNQMLQKQASRRAITPFKAAANPSSQRSISNLRAIASTSLPPASPEQTTEGNLSVAPGQLNKQTYTIACIDDSLTVLNAIKSFLDDRMFSLLMINSPVQALMQVVRSKPDLILLDVEMPNLDGYELCSLLRRHPSFKHTPIIMVTGHTGFVDRAKAKLVRASGYLTKPFTQSDLLKMVFKYLT